MSLQIFLGYTANGSQFLIIETLRMKNVDTDFCTHTHTHTQCAQISLPILFITITIHSYSYKSHSILM